MLGGNSRADCIKQSLDSKIQVANSPKDPAFLLGRLLFPWFPSFFSLPISIMPVAQLFPALIVNLTPENTATRLQ